MKSISVKIGKVINSLKQEGIISGTKKTLRYFLVFLGSILQQKSGSILLIAGGVGDSARYRIRNHAEELNIHGIKSAVALQDDPFLINYVDKFKVFIFHRTMVSEKMKKMIEKIKDQRKTIIFETDDLLFDPKYFAQSNYMKNINTLEKNNYSGGLGAEFIKDSYVEVCTTSTSFLAEKLKNFGKKVFIVPNKLSLEDLEVIEELQTTNYKPQTIVKLAYFSGTMGHNRDFGTISGALIRIMEAHSNIELILAGPLEIGEIFSKFGSRIKKIPFVSRKKHFENISQTDITIVPLEMNDFCEAKSELKFFEAGIFSVPTVAVRNQTFSEAIDDGVDGFLAGTEQEWVEKIEALIINKKLRETIGENARKKTLEKYTTKNSNNEEYYNYLKSKI